MTERFSMPGLKPAVWTVDVAQDEDLEAALGRAGRLGANVQGIAYTTAGARALRSVSGQSLCDTGDNEVPLDTIYELRLWAVTRRGGEDDGVLAHELRWLNGAGSADVTLRGIDDDDRAGAPEKERCWYRPNDYLQHSADETDARNMPIMTSVEVFTEAEYGNTVFVDELMTGEWKRNG